MPIWMHNCVCVVCLVMSAYVLNAATTYLSISYELSFLNMCFLFHNGCWFVRVKNMRGPSLVEISLFQMFSVDRWLLVWSGTCVFPQTRNSQFETIFVCWQVNTLRVHVVIVFIFKTMSAVCQTDSRKHADTFKSLEKNPGNDFFLFWAVSCWVFVSKCPRRMGQWAIRQTIVWNFTYGSFCAEFLWRRAQMDLNILETQNI